MINEDNNIINNKPNISFFFEEKELPENTFSMQDLLDEFNKNNSVENRMNSISYDEINYYDIINNKSDFEKYTVNGLLRICDYYNLLKCIKMARYKKNDIIDSILMFESDENNREIVNRRYRLWSYIEELSKDKFMKKYIIWK